MFGWLARAWLIRRLHGGRDRRRGGYGGGWGYPMGPAPYGYGRRRRRGRVGWFGPMPYYSGRTRGGTRVSVGGCCLPIPLTLGVGLVAALRALERT